MKTNGQGFNQLVIEDEDRRDWDITCDQRLADWRCPIAEVAIAIYEPDAAFMEEQKAYAREIVHRFNAHSDLLSEMQRYLPILERLMDEHVETWDECARGTGIATLNGYKAALAKAAGTDANHDRT